MLGLVAGTTSKTTVVPVGPVGIVMLLGRNPLRLYVEFSRGPTAAVLRQVIPGPVPSGYAGRTNPTEPQVYKFHDCPATVAGEWYADQQAGIDWTIIECLAEASS